MESMRAEGGAGHHAEVDDQREYQHDAAERDPARDALFGHGSSPFEPAPTCTRFTSDWRWPSYATASWFDSLKSRAYSLTTAAEEPVTETAVLDLAWSPNIPVAFPPPTVFWVREGVGSLTRFRNG